MERSRFQKGDLVIYINGLSIELGVVGSITPSGKSYFVSYHQGGTRASTPSRMLVPVSPKLVAEVLNYQALANSYAVPSLLLRRLLILDKIDYPEYDPDDLIDFSHRDSRYEEVLMRSSYGEFYNLNEFIDDARECYVSLNPKSLLSTFDDVLKYLVGDENFTTIRKGEVTYVK